MKKTISIVLLLLVTVGMYAQDGINYKALIKDNLGAVLANQTIDVRFTIIADTGPTNVYIETHTGATTDANGIVILTIGSVITPTLGVFADISWSSDTHSLKVEIDIEQDASFVDMGTTQFMSVPYALQANAATELTGGIDQAYIAALEAQIAALATQPAAIGDLRAGGVVFWLDSTGLHGLVCALSDYSTTVEWGCDGSDLPNVTNVPYNGGIPVGLGAEIGDGFNNTNDILTDCTSAPAALAARSLGTEWFLPSAKELNQMYINKTTLEDAAGFTAFSNSYWSSTEALYDIAWKQYFSNGSQNPNVKPSPGYVRAVRAF
jgi:hypothetical protein|tara:strand:+ start:231 stop:1193 length:963 start_codon:yes stop_codon:yes gene_type:complete